MAKKKSSGWLDKYQYSGVVYDPSQATVAKKDETSLAPKVILKTKKQAEQDKIANEAMRKSNELAQKDRETRAKAKKAQDRKDEIQDRRDRITVANAVQPYMWSSPENFAVATSAIADKLRFSEEPNFFDDYINPGVYAGHGASVLGKIPLNLQQGDYKGAAMNFATPVIAGTAEKLITPIIGKVAGAGKKALKKGIDQFTETGRALARIEREGIKKGLSRHEINMQQMNEVGITSRQREGYVPGISDFAYKYITPQGYTGKKGASKLSQIIENYKKGGVNYTKVKLDPNLPYTGKHYEIADVPPSREDAWRLYLGIPQKYGTFEMAQTAPIQHIAYTPKQLSNLELFSLSSPESKTGLFPDIDLPGFDPYLGGGSRFMKSDNTKIFRYLDNPVTVERNNIVMGGHNKRLSRSGLEYNDVWDLEPDVAPYNLLPDKLKIKFDGSPLFFKTTSPGTQSLRSFKLPVDKFFGKPFMTHGVEQGLTSEGTANMMKKATTDRLNFLKSQVESYDKTKDPKFLIDEFDYPTNYNELKSSISHLEHNLEYLKQYPKFKQGGNLDKYQYSGTVAKKDAVTVQQPAKVRLKTKEEIARDAEIEKARLAAEAAKRQTYISADNISPSQRAAVKKARERQDMINNSQLAQTFGSLTPTGYNPTAGGVAANQFMYTTPAIAAGAVAGPAILPYIGAAMEAPIAGVAGLTANNLLNAGFAYEAANNIPNVASSVKKAFKNPTSGNIADASLQTGYTALNALPFVASALPGVRSTLGEAVSAFRKTPSINTSAEPKRYIRPSHIIDDLFDTNIGRDFTESINEYLKAHPELAEQYKLPIYEPGSGSGLFPTGYKTSKEFKKLVYDKNLSHLYQRNKLMHGCGSDAECAKIANSIASSVSRQILPGEAYNYSANADNAWYTTYQMLKNEGELVYNEGVHGPLNSDILKNVQVGDQVMFGPDAFLAHPQQSPLTGNLKEPRVNHRATVVGMSPDGNNLLISESFDGRLITVPIQNNVYYNAASNRGIRSIVRPQQFVGKSKEIAKRAILNDINLNTGTIDFGVSPELEPYKEVYDKIKPTLIGNLGIHADELDQIFRHVLGIGIQESKMSGKMAKGLTKAKVLIQDKLREVGLTKPVKEVINAVKEYGNRKYVENPDLLEFPGKSKMQMEASKLAEKEGISFNEALESLYTTTYNRPKPFALSNTDPSVGTFRQKYLSKTAKRLGLTEGDLKIGKGSKNDFYNSTENELTAAIANFYDLKNSLAKKHPDWSDQKLFDMATLSWNSPSKANNQELVDYFYEFKDNPKFEGFDYLNKVKSNIKQHAPINSITPTTEIQLTKPFLQFKQGGWLDKYEDGGDLNANNYTVSAPEGYEGSGYSNVGRNYSPAWGGQFQMGGSLPGAVGHMYAREGAPRNFGGKMTAPSAQNGTQFPGKPTSDLRDIWNANKSARDFNLQYTQSPNFINLLKKQGYTDAEIKQRHQAIVDLDESRTSYNSPDYNHVNPDEQGIERLQYNPKGLGDWGSWGDVAAHEWGHVGVTSDGPLALKPAEQKLLTDSLNWANVSKNPKDREHDIAPQENRADLVELRKALQDRKIYDSFKGGEFKQEHLDKLYRQDPEYWNRSMRLYKDKDIIKLMNTIASNDVNQGIPVAADGIELNETEPVKQPSTKNKRRIKQEEEIMNRAPLDIIEEGRSKFRYNMLEDAVRHDMAAEQNIDLGAVDKDALDKRTKELLVKRESKLANPTVEFVTGSGTASGTGPVLGYYDPENKGALISLSDNLDKYGIDEFGNTVRHEFRHAYDDGGRYLTEYEKNLISNKTMGTSEQVSKKLEKIGVDKYRYLSEPTEVTGRLQEIRGALKKYPLLIKNDESNNVGAQSSGSGFGSGFKSSDNQYQYYDPKTDKATLEHVNSLKGKVSGLRDLLKIMSPEDVVELLNTIAANDPQQGLPMAQNGMQFYQNGLDFKPKSISKNGSVIEDDMGQWAHPGKVTKIKSNKITMKGVPYPVLGISDTGDTQMMYPNQEYQFIGDSVTEYPMMKQGGQLTKLDQLTNFTNYNTKQPGGWLDKYQD